jgi:hypothetical protein
MSDVSKALKTAFELGKTYWMQADSQSFAEQRRSDETFAKFRALESSTLQALQHSGEPVGQVYFESSGAISVNWFDAKKLAEDDLLYTTPQPVVLEAKVWNQAEGRDGKLYADGWNACRDAMLSAGKGGEQP